MKIEIRLASTIFSSLLILAFQQPSLAEEKPSFKLEGFAAVKAYGLDTTTGGGNAAVQIVHTPQEFLAAAERADIPDKKARASTPRVIQIANDLDLGVLANQRGGNVLKSVGIVHIGANTTIFSAGEGVTLHHGTLEIHGASNIIIRNLRFRDLWELDPTGKYDRFGWDFVRITNAGKGRSHHIWVDHCDFGKVYDGACDITHGSDLITVSWCRFGGDEAGPHKKVMLIGHSSSAGGAAMDTGRLNVTLHHNYFHNIDDRTPRVRFGNVHVFNDMVDGAENANISVMKAVTLVENCVYKDVRVATTFSHASDTVKKGRNGTLVVVNSLNENPRQPNPDEEIPPETEDSDDTTDATLPNPAATATPTKKKAKDPNREFELAHNFASSIERPALQFNAPTEWTWENRSKLPYDYQLDPVENVPALLAKFTGTGKMELGIDK